MKLAILGASAGVGLEAVRYALERGHDVTTLSRSIDSLPKHARLTVVQGSSLRDADVRRAVAGADTILVALGSGNSTKATTLHTDSCKVLMGVLRDTDADPPLVILTGFGAGDSWDYNSPLMKLMFTFLLKDIYRNKAEMERMVAASGRRWTIVRAGRLTNGPRTGVYRVLTKLERGMRVGAISRADTAHFMVSEAEQPKCTGLYPALSY